MNRRRTGPCLQPMSNSTNTERMAAHMEMFAGSGGFIQCFNAGDAIGNASQVRNYFPGAAPMLGASRVPGVPSPQAWRRRGMPFTLEACSCEPHVALGRKFDQMQSFSADRERLSFVPVNRANA